MTESSEPTGDTQGPIPTPDQEQRLATVVEQYLRELQSGHEPDIEQLAKLHPDVAPFLRKRCEFIGRLFGQMRMAETVDVDRHDPSVTDDPSQVLAHYPHGEQSQRLNCPHCGIAIQLVSLREEITCANCGSTFQVDSRATASLTPEKQPQQIGRFLILATIGRGGFGVVYKGRDPKLDRLVAIKVPRYGYFLSEEEEQRFLREARSAARLRHHAIVQVFEVSHDGVLPYIVSEYIDGLTLADLASGQRTTFRRAAELIAQVAEALEYAHENHVVHRDVKPSNILIDSTGRPFVTDFGLARADETEFTITLQGQVLGTPSYMSPEQAEGQNDKIDRRSDVYSLGVILYRLLCGELPFRGSKRMLMHQVVHVEPCPPRSINDNVPKDLNTITVKAMAKEPARRYQTAREFAADLQRWLRGEPIHAKPVGWLGRTWRWSRRNPALASLSAAVAVGLLLTASVAIGWGYREMQLSRQTQLAYDRERDAHQRAADNARDSRRHLMQTLTGNGLHALEMGDYFTALLWNCEALSQSEDPYDQRIHRLRIASLLQQLPRLEQSILLESPMEQAVTSLDPPRVLARLRSGSIVAWDPMTGQVLDTLPILADVVDIALSRNGQVAAAACRGGTGQIWHFGTASRQPFIVRHDSWLTQVAVSPDAKLVASGSDDKSARIWDSSSGVQRHKLDHPARVTQLTFSPDGSRLATVSGQSDTDYDVRVWDVQSGELLGLPIVYERLPDGTGRVVWSVEFSPDGQTVFCVCDDDSIVVWDVETSEPVTIPMVHTAALLAATFSPDGSRLAAGDVSGLVQIWDARSGMKSGQAFSHPGPAGNFHFSPDGELLAVASAGSVWLWHLADQKQLLPRITVDDDVKLAGFFGTRALATHSATGMLRSWDLRAEIDRLPTLPHDGAVLDCEYDSSGQWIVTASRDGSARIWSARDGQLLQTISLGAEVLQVRFSPVGALLVTSDASNQVRFWDVATGAERPPALVHPQSITRLVLSPRGDLVVTGSQDGGVRGWEVASRTQRFAALHELPVRGLDVSSDGNWIASCSEDKTARIWNARDGQPVGPPLAHDSPVLDAVLSEDATLLFTICRDGTLHVWDVAQSTRRKTITVHSDHGWTVVSGPLLGQVLSTDLVGSAVLTGWEAEPPVMTRLSNSQVAVHRGRFDHSGQLIATACGPAIGSNRLALGNGAARIWEAATGNPVTPELRHFGSVVDLDFHPVETAIVTASRDHSARIWRLDPEVRSVQELRKLVGVLSGRRIDLLSGVIVRSFEQPERSSPNDAQ